MTERAAKLAAADVLPLATLMQDIVERKALNAEYLRASLEVAAYGLEKQKRLNAASLSALVPLIYDVMAAARPTPAQVDHFAQIAASVYFGARA